ncbi:hypothetical protein [Burkholderia sp. Ax-1719]|uniref:hypothetical protein n=1 Tax=Burkholderia sp. Ax-1719 TaxID=2608334 RepID=UPI0014217F10|nr:hypothetical protein [Burkholderia sp. Ax-1719]
MIFLSLSYCSSRSARLRARDGESAGKLLPESDRRPHYEIGFTLSQHFGPLRNTGATKPDCTPEFSATAAEYVNRLLLGQKHLFPAV